MRRIATRQAAGLLAVIVSCCILPSHALKSQDDTRLRQRNQYWNLAKQYQQQGNIPQAQRAIEQVIAIEKQVYGAYHSELVASHEFLAKCQHAQEKFADADKTWLAVIDISTRVHGKDDWRTVNARWDLEQIRVLAKLTADERQLVAKASHTHHAVLASMQKAELTLDLLKQIQEVLDVRRKYLGEASPQYATSLSLQAALSRQLGQMDKAEEAARLCEKVRLKSLGENHPSYALALSELSFILDFRGESTQKVQALEKALGIMRKTVGEQHQHYDLVLNNLGTTYLLLGDYAKAEPMLRQSLAFVAKSHGTDSSTFAMRLNTVGMLYYLKGDLAQAAPIFGDALEILRKTVGTRHIQYALVLQNLGALSMAQGKRDQAGKLLDQAADIYRQIYGNDHIEYALARANLAGVHLEQKQFAKAEELYQQTLAIRKKHLGESHLVYLGNVENLAVLYRLQRDFDKAAPLYRQVWETSRRNLAQIQPILTEGQHLAMEQYLRGFLHDYLIFAQQANVPADEVYERVFATKGAVYLQQKALRDFRATLKANPESESARQFAELERYSRELARLSSRIPPFDSPKQVLNWRIQLAELSERRESVEKKLAAGSAAFRKAQTTVSVSEARKLLPADTAFVDFLEYAPIERWRLGLAPVDPHLLAFVVRRDHETQLIDLGPSRAIVLGMEDWRKAILADRDELFPAAAAQVRRLVWEPLRPHLRDAKVVLISPDGPIHRLPWGALPGDKRGQFLIEEIAVGMVPVPQMLPQFLTPGGNPGKPSLLIFGNIDFGKKEHLLPGTKAEADSIRKIFSSRHGEGSVTVREEQAATETEFRRLAPQFRWVHLATHGAYKSADKQHELKMISGTHWKELMSTGLDPLGSEGLMGMHPGLLSSVLFAGASMTKDRDGEDGILHALEAAQLNLRQVDLLVLAACQTGLGKEAAGEGIIGLPRAFQIAGVRTTVVTLWNVDDLATRQLMERFYQNLLAKDSSLSKLEALRQAQVWFLREGRPLHPDLAKGKGPIGPDYWAAFQLSGDWR